MGGGQMNHSKFPLAVPTEKTEIQDNMSGVGHHDLIMLTLDGNDTMRGLSGLVVQSQRD